MTKLLALIDEDAENSEPLSKAYGMPKDTPEQAAEKDQVSVGERFDAVPCEPGSRALDDVDDFVLVMEVPGVLEIIVVALLDFERGAVGKPHLLVHDFDFVFHGVGIDGFMQIYQQKMQKNHLLRGLLFSIFEYLL